MFLKTLFLSFLVSASSAEQSSASQKVLWVPLKGTVELGLAPYIQRALKHAQDQGYDALILDVDTFGGRVDAAVSIRDALIDAKIPTVAWINKRAISAGALISLSCRKIYFTPGSTMGAATPIQMSAEGGAAPVENKVVSYFRAEMGSTAERNGRDRKVAEAMVSATDDLKDLVKKGDVLTLTDVSAQQTKISDGTISSEAELLGVLNLKNAQVDVFEINWAERIVRFLTDPTVSSLLMSGGVLGLFIEFQAPGFGLPGIFGITCLALFFFGKWIVHLAGWEEILLFLLGLGLIGAELLLFPGTIIPIVTGLALVLAALFFAGISPKVPFEFSSPDVRHQLTQVSIAFIVAVVGLILGYFFMARSTKRSVLVQGETLDRNAGYASSDSLADLLNEEGELTTDLRPTGKAHLKGQTVEVISQGEFLKKGLRVRVVQVEGSKVVVSKIDEGDRS